MDRLSSDYTEIVSSQPLKYQYITGEIHLTFDSIRSLVFHKLNKQDEVKAKRHVQNCFRCKSIYQSLVNPEEVRKNRVRSKVKSNWLHGLMLIGILMVLATAFWHFRGMSYLSVENLHRLLSGGPQNTETNQTVKPIPIPPKSGSSQDLIKSDPVSELKPVDSLLNQSGEPETENIPSASKMLHSSNKTENGSPETTTRGIYGKISANGAALHGVTIKVPGSRSAKVSDSSGKYYLQIPRSATSILFIYRGKQLIKELDPDSRHLDVNLKIDNMDYPEIETTEPGTSNIVIN